MFRHGPSCLSGPVTSEHPWWNQVPIAPPPPSRKPRRADAPIRAELVARVRREIAEGTYDTPEKWESALDRLFDRLEQE